MGKFKTIAEICPNVYNLAEKLIPHKRRLKVEDITEMTLVVEGDGFNVQTLMKNYVTDDIYFIPKYNVVLTYEQMIQFAKDHSEENFLVGEDSYIDVDDFWTFITSEPNQLTLHVFGTTGDSHLKLMAMLQTKYGGTSWEKIEKYDPFITRITSTDPNGYSYRESENKKHFVINRSQYPNRSLYSKSIDSLRIINDPNHSGSADSTSDLLRDYINIVGKTRITLEPDRQPFRYSVSDQANVETKTIAERYGLLTTGKGWYYEWGDRKMYDLFDTFDPSVPQEDWDRVTKRLEAKLLEQDADTKICNGDILKASTILITKPLPGHRRPTFHYICGFRTNKTTDIVELACGELLVKDMLPEEIYGLMKDGRYAHLSHTLKSDMRSLIKDAEIDPESYNIWAEERSLHPNLLVLLGTNYLNDIDLELIKLFNRLPFGSLLVEQMITSGHVGLGVGLASYITAKSYDFNTYCSQLNDLFPECNGEATSLYKILNISKKTAHYLFADIKDNEYEKFILKYKAIHRFGGNIDLTNDIKSNVDTYLDLFSTNQHKLKLGWANREFDFLDYPKLAKQVLKMRKKISALDLVKDKKMDILNKYDEIVRAYASFLDYADNLAGDERELWLPEHQKIYVEFSLLGTPERPFDPYEEVSSREKDANKALDIYKDKASEEIHKENEEKFANRRTALNRLRSLAKLAKENKDFSRYVIIPPTKIYGVHTEGSVEKEANDLDHCLFRCYTQRIIDGDYTALWLRLADKPEKSLITVGITKDGRIEQTRGEGDRDATPEEARAIAAWAMSKAGMVTFKSEGADVQPGGWPRNLGVPSLPLPDKDWLKKLRSNAPEII